MHRPLRWTPNRLRRSTIALLLAGAAAVSCATLPTNAHASSMTTQKSVAWRCTDGDTAADCVSNAFALGGWHWLDVDIGCPDALPNADVDSITTHGSDLIAWYGPYDNGPADGGHFWLRTNNLLPKTSTIWFTWRCTA